MESSRSTCSNHKAWRRIAKKERRRRLRRKAAQERKTDEQRLRAALERSAEYLNWLEEEEKEAQIREAREQEEHAEREKLWLEEEERAQKEWQNLQERKAKARQQQLEQEVKIREEFEAKREAIRKKEEEEKRKREEEIRNREKLQKEIDDYIDAGVKTPETLREVTDSQPGKELCPFFTKTGSCRYGDTCSRNHRKVYLSKVILLPGFYSHFSLEKNSAEYDTDVALEFESSEMRQHFREFYKDVVPELESFGNIKTLKLCRNTEIHLRGNLYVEYYTEREAARALRKLKGRWYAGRRLNCEFTNLKSWRSAVCGMLKCPKGRACNFLHTFKNPRGEYEIKSPPRWAKGTASQESSNKRSEQKNKSTWEESIRGSTDESRNWRWSESPELEVNFHSRKKEKSRRTNERSPSRKRSRRDRKSDANEKFKDRSSKTSTTSKSFSSERTRRPRSSIGSKKDHSNKTDDGNDSFDEDDVIRKIHSPKSRKRRKQEKDDDSFSENIKYLVDRTENVNTCKYYNSKYNMEKKKRCEKDSDSSENSKRRSIKYTKTNSVRSKKKHDIETPKLRKKWDHEELDDSSSGSVESNDSDSSITIDSKNNYQRKISNDPSGWTTTDSDNEDQCKLSSQVLLPQKRINNLS